MKYLITGANGFVGNYLIDHLLNDSDTSILGLDLNIGYHESNRVEFKEVNLLDKDLIQKIIKVFNPDFLVHLAAFSSVGKSWDDPESCFKNNTDIFVNILESIRFYCPLCRVLSVGSSEEYGIINKADIPVNEEKKLEPNNPYAVARVAQELLTKVYVQGYGLNIVMTRSFNHIGPGQRIDFAIPSFISKIIESENNQIEIGDINVIRDFTDVRDVVMAYDLLLKKGKKGEVYNICSGKGVKLVDILNTIAEILGKPNVKYIIDKNLVRPIETPVVIGNNKKILKHVGWSPKISLRKSLEDTVHSLLRDKE